MQLNKNYNQQFNKREILKITNKLENRILSFLRKKFSFLQVELPSFVNEKTIINKNNIIKNVTFFNYYDNVEFSYNSEPIIQLLNLNFDLKLKNNEGFFAKTVEINREQEETAMLTFQNFKLLFLFKISKKENVNHFINSLSHEIYETIWHFFNDITKKKKIENFIKLKRVLLTTPTILENEFKSISYNLRLQKQAEVTGVFWLKNFGLKTTTGHTYQESSFLYNWNNQISLVMNNINNSYYCSPFFISEIANGNVLKTQMKNLELVNHEIIMKSLENNDKFIILSFDLPKLIMSFLNLGHISETQLGVESKETTNIKLKKIIEIF